LFHFARAKHSAKLKSKFVESKMVYEMRITRRFWYAFEIIGVLVILVLGLAFGGFFSTGEQLPPEKQPPFQASLKRAYDHDVTDWGDIKITMQPENAFVIGESISSSVELRMSYLKTNETAYIELVFPESISMLSEEVDANYSEYEQRIYLQCNSSSIDCQKNLTLWYVHEGIFGVNVTVTIIHTYGPPEMGKFIFPQVVQIKSYSYLEERRNTQLTNALNQKIFGLTIIAISPVVVTLLELVERVYKASDTKRRTH